MQSCPARGKECHNCGQTGYCAKFCRSAKKSDKNIRNVEQPKREYLQDSDDENCFTLSSIPAKSPETQISIGDTNVKVLVDSGASVNIVHHHIFNQIRKNNDSIQLVPTKAKIRAYGSEDPIELAGKFETTIQSSTGQQTDATFYVTSGLYKCILGYQSSTELGLITLNINSLTQHENPTIAKILQQLHHLFQGTGNLKDVEVTLEIDESVTPVAQAPRRIPHNLKKKVNDKLQELRESGIIEKVDGATPWLSPPIAIPKKTGDVRLVLDMRLPNTALARRRVQIPTVDEILRHMEGAKFFIPKCSFMVPEVNVFGHIISGNGIRPDDAKIKAVNQAPPPKTCSEVRSFLGLTNYCSRYIPNYSTITYPLRQLTKAHAMFIWTNVQEQAFLALKRALTSALVLAHYSLEAKTRVVVDASPWALGAVLLQEQQDGSYRPIAFGSRSLSETEQKYGRQVKKESLAIVFGCEHFHVYLYGRNFEIETDHRPLEHIYKPKATNTGKPTPARIERCMALN